MRKSMWLFLPVFCLLPTNRAVAQLPANYYELEYWSCTPSSCSNATTVPVANGEYTTSVIGLCYNGIQPSASGTAFAMNCDPPVILSTSGGTTPRGGILEDGIKYMMDGVQTFADVFDAALNELSSSNAAMWCDAENAVEETPVQPCNAPPPPPPGGGGGCDCPDGCPPCTVKFLSPDKKGHLILASPQDCCHATTPILIDVSGKGFVLTDAANGVTFDIMGTGRPIQMGWTAEGVNNAFLALPGADGLVHSGKQLFGNYTPQPRSPNPNGFAALAIYDDPKNGGNGNGEIDPGDAIYSQLRLWIDINHDGICQPEELHTLPSLGVSSISLNYKDSQRVDQYGNVFHYRALVDKGDSTHVGRTAYDVYFVSIQPPAQPGTMQAQKCPAPNPYFRPAAPATTVFNKKQ